MELLSPAGRGADATGTTRAMRGLLLVAALLVFIIGVPLFVLTTATETYFAWTIATPLTAAFLGASYWAAGILELLAARQERWSNARIAVPAVLLFTVLTLAVTLIHIDRFHFAAVAPVTLLVTWSWLIVYAVVPVLMVIILILQRRGIGGDPPRAVPLPDGLRLVLGIQSVIMAVFGLGLLLATSATASLWPWSLTPLTARAIGAWLLSIGVSAAHAAWENDRARIRPFAVSYLVFAVLQAVALARFPSDFAWGTAAATLYLAFLASQLLVGAWFNFGRGRRSLTANS
ncbi:hypothetical protein [Taklimakanibacter lacteus]|uniref:hypothetical protein n=1 Tax=Taklimakanibacter lacteus TaxID=2268456 RepID=UPI0013C47DDE